MGLEKKMNRLLFSTMIPMACLLAILLLIFWQYAGQYNKLSENLAVSSKFNLSFKDELDLEMYYLAIGSKEASELDDVLGQVDVYKRQVPGLMRMEIPIRNRNIPSESHVD